MPDINILINAFGQASIPTSTHIYINSGCSLNVQGVYTSYENAFGSPSSANILGAVGLIKPNGDIIRFYSPAEAPTTVINNTPLEAQFNLTPKGINAQQYINCYTGSSTLNSTSCPNDIVVSNVALPSTVSGNTINWNGSSFTSYFANYNTNSLCCI